MIKRITALLLAFVIYAVSAPFFNPAYGESSYAADGDVKETIELKIGEVSDTSAELLWNYTEEEDALLQDPEEIFLLSVYEDEELVSESTIKSANDSEDQEGNFLYNYSQDSGYSCTVDGLDAGKTYELQIETEESCSNMAAVSTKDASVAAPRMMMKTGNPTDPQNDDTENGNTDPSNPNPDDPNPDDPKPEDPEPVILSLATKDLKPTSVVLVWNLQNPTGKELFYLYEGNTVIASNIKGNSYTLEDLKERTKKTLTLKVKANASTDFSASVKNVSFITPKVYASVPKASKPKSNKTTITWTVSKEYKGGVYNIYKIVNKKKVYVKKKVKVNAKTRKASYTIKKLAPGKTHKFYIEEKYTKVVKKVTVKNPLPNVKGFKALSSHNGVILKWKRAKNATGYIINWSGNGNKGKVVIKGGKKTSHVMWAAPDATYTYSIRATKDKLKSPKKTKIKGAAVRTMHYSVQFNTDRELYSHSGGSVRAYFTEGTWITATGFTEGKYIFWHEGRMYYVTRISMRNASVSHHDVGKTYTVQEAESFVNRLGLYSNTEYLIWVNTYTQKEYIFKGSKGKWKLQNKTPWPVSTGAPESPTETGLARIRQKDIAVHDSFYWSVCSSYSIHSKPPSQGQPLGWPFSGSCVRNVYENAKWIYYNCAIGTSVYVF